MDSVRSPSPIAEEAEDEDSASSVYAQTIKRIIGTKGRVPTFKLKLHMPPENANEAYPSDLIEMERIKAAGHPDRRSIRSVSINDNASGYYDRNSQYENSPYDYDFSSDNQPIEFALPSEDNHPGRPPPFARRYFQQQSESSFYGQNDGAHQEYIITGNHQNATTTTSTNSSDTNGEPDLNTKWSWKNLKREFKLSHSESLFHSYQAKLQHSFFVALLILNIIFNIGAIGSYALSKYHEMNLYLILMRVSSIFVFASFLLLIWFNQLWMQSNFSRTVASLAVLMAMIFGEASK